MKKLPYLLFLLLSSWGFSQSLSPEVTASAGDHFTGTNTQLSWTIGETITETYVNNPKQLTQGFHQTNLIPIAVEDLDERFQVKVFPNPTLDVLSIEWSELSSPITLSLFDAHGKLLQLQKTHNQSKIKTLDLTGYSAGNYLLHLYNPDGQIIKTFKILKIK